MSHDKTPARKALKSFGGGIVGALLATTLGVGLLYLKFGWGLIHLSYDLPFAIRPVIKPSAVVMVYLDDDSHQILNQPYNAPWDRSLHAQLLNHLTADGAKAVVFDIVFSDAGPNPQADEEFAKAIRDNGHVVLAADSVPADYASKDVQARQIVPPYDSFFDAASAIGLDELHPDEDQVIRRQILMSPDDQVPTMGWAVAKVLGATVTKNSKNQFAPYWLNYYGPAATIRSVSFYQAISTNASDAVPSGFFSNKVVFVGAHLFTKFSGERKDEYPTPYSRWRKEYPFMPAPEIQATAFLNLLRGDWLNQLSANAELAIFMASGALFGFGLARFRPLAATSISILLAALVCISAYLSFVHLRIWFPWLLLEVQIFIALAWSVVFNSIQLYVQKKLLEQALARYLSPKLVKKFAGRPDLLRPGASKQMLTILFSDIANFTSISEGIDSDELAKLMNNYFERSVSGCIHRTDGTVVKYIGDAIFAFWNAPEIQTDHAMRACQAALHFRKQGVTEVRGQPLYTRIGLHTGVANVGNFGSSTRVDYTAIGENINLASRMEGLNKYLGTQVLITGETKNEIGERLVTRALGKFRLKGFEKSVDVFELISEPETAAASEPLRKSFAAALLSFEKRKFDEAAVQFQKVLEIAPDDGPAKFYLKQIHELRAQTISENWTGEIELKEK